jgi:hypothetical protein
VKIEFCKRGEGLEGSVLLSILLFSRDTQKRRERVREIWREGAGTGHQTRFKFVFFLEGGGRDTKTSNFDTDTSNCLPKLNSRTTLLYITKENNRRTYDSYAFCRIRLVFLFFFAPSLPKRSTL